MLMAMNENIHKIHIHLIVLQVHELFPHMTLPPLRSKE